MEIEGEKYDLSYETLWKAIIRPPRDIYTPDDLIDNIFTFKKKTYYRKDYDLINKQGLTLKCSFIEPDDDSRPYEIMPVVIYLHGNSSSRLEGIKMVPALLKHNINLFVFDFSGSGISEGDYISLGMNEKEDLSVIVDFVSKIPGVGNIGLWGRSMGAATAMLYCKTDKRIKAAVFDSPFTEFRLLAKQLCSNYKSIPFWLVDFAFLFIKKTIISKNGLDIDKLVPIECAKETKTPGFFVHAMNDELIPLEHSLKLYEEYGGEKSLNVCEGGHNTKRKKHIIDKIGKFYTKYLYPGEEFKGEIQDDEQKSEKESIWDEANYNNEDNNNNQ